MNQDPLLTGYACSYLKMTSVAKEGGTVINYSDRFNMPDMTGVTQPQYAQAAAAVSGTDGPPTVNGVVNDAGAGAAAPAAGAAGGMYTVPYALQSGLTKYAPMQVVPPTKISIKNFTPRYPTSAYTIATTWLPKPTVVTTLTASQTFSVKSIENTVSHWTLPYS